MLLQNLADWRLFDDSRVSDVTEDRAVNDQAYLLLYRRRGDPFTLPPPVVGVQDAQQQEQQNPVISNESHARESNPIRVAPDNRLANTTSISVSGAPQPRTFPTLQLTTQPYHVTTINTFASCSDDASSDEGLSNSSYRATSMINTNDAACGNLVSDIVIEDGGIVGGSVPGPDDAALPECAGGAGNFEETAHDQHVFPGPSNGGNVFSSSLNASNEPIVLDEATPMSVSSASQPSLSSTEEESISTAQEELD